MNNMTWLNWRMVVIDCDDLCFYEKGLALYLNTYMNDRQNFAFPSISTICKEMSLSRATVVKYLDELELKGFLIKQKRFNKSNVYRVAFPQNSIQKFAQNYVSSSSPDEVENANEVVHQMNWGSSPDELANDAEVVHQMNWGSSPRELELVHHVDTNNQFNNQLNNQERCARENVRPKRTFKPPSLSDVFEYAKSKNYEHVAKVFFDFYTAGDWHDSNGKKVKNWKQKFISWINREIKNESNQRANSNQPNKHESNHARVMRKCAENAF